MEQDKTAFPLHLASPGLVLREDGQGSESSLVVECSSAASWWMCGHAELTTPALSPPPTWGTSSCQLARRRF